MGFFKDLAKQKAKQMILKFILANLPLVILVVAAIITILVIISTYQLMTSNQYLTGLTYDKKEVAKVKQRYEKLVDKWNREDCWLGGGRGIKEGLHYPSRTGKELNQMVDRDRKDYALRMKWGLIHSVVLYYTYTKGLDRLLNQPGDDLPDKIAEALHPYFYYRKETDIHCYQTKDGTVCYPHEVYLLTEAHTITGWYTYTYYLKHYPSGSEIWTLESTQEHYGDRYKFLKEQLKKLLDINSFNDEGHIMVYEGGEGFTAAKEWVDFLMQHPEIAIEYTTSSSIPGEYLDMLEEAEKKFGVPKEVMAAVIQRESSWDPFAENGTTKCFGLTGQHPDYYAERWKKLGFDPIKDKWNPRAQILAGAMVLADYCGKVDWDNYAQDENFKKGLLRYVGGSDATWYVDDIVKLAQSFARPAGWPVPNYTRVSSPFDWRKDPVTGEYTFHYGIDIPCPTGTPVVSVSAGKVISTGYSDTYGNNIRIRDITHEYLYAHLSEMLVSAGEEVTPGETIGKSGSTGKSTGPHLHFGIKDLTNGDPRWVDPLLILTQ